MLKLFLSTTNLRYDFGLETLHHRPKGRCLTVCKGKITNLTCPCCGSSNPKINGFSNTLFCIACNSKIDISEKNAEILIKAELINELEISGLDKEAKNNRIKSFRKEQKTTLKCGDKGLIRGKSYLVIGVIIKENIKDPQYKWVEYLLYQAGGANNFIWLIEDITHSLENEGWKISQQINDTPNESKNTLIYKKQTYKIKEEEEGYSSYYGKTNSVWGAFNWEINVGDVTYYTDYYGINNNIVCKELISNKEHKEISFNFSTKINTKEIIEGFKLEKEKIQKIHYLNNLEENNTHFFNSFYFYALLTAFLFFTPYFFAALMGTCLSGLFWFIEKNGKPQEELENYNLTKIKWIIRLVFCLFLLALFYSKNTNNSNDNGSSFRSYSGFIGGHK